VLLVSSEYRGRCMGEGHWMVERITKSGPKNEQRWCSLMGTCGLAIIKPEWKTDIQGKM